MAKQRQPEPAERRDRTANPDAGGIRSDLLRRALSTAAEGITISDPSQPDNPLIYVNDGFQTLTGYTAEDVLGKNCRFLQGARTDPAASERIRTAIRAQRPCVVELVNHRKDGTPFWNRLSITPVRDASGRVTHFIGVQSDITERKEAERALSQARDELQQANKQMTDALESAATVQRALLPHGFTGGKGVRVAWRLEACATLAGDTLNSFWLDETHLGCYILDVMGHGVPAALLSVTLSHFLSPRSSEAFLCGPVNDHPEAQRIFSPADVGDRLNKRFPLDTENQRFFTILYGVLDTKSMTLTYFSAGHPPLIHQTRGVKATALAASGFPIGIVDTPAYEDITVDLEPGDRMFFYSDGVPETQNSAGEEFGIDALLRTIEAGRDKSLDGAVDAIWTRLKEWSTGKSLRDDISILALEIDAP